MPAIIVGTHKHSLDLFNEYVSSVKKNYNATQKTIKDIRKLRKFKGKRDYSRLETHGQAYISIEAWNKE